MIFFSSDSIAQKVDPTNKTARKIYRNHLSLLKNSFVLIHSEKGINLYATSNSFDDTTSFLVKLTNLDCYNYTYEGCEVSKENYLDWKAWYKLNKKNLYLIGDSVKIKGSPVPVKKNPVKYFKKNLKLVKKSLKYDFFLDPPYIDAISFLIDLTEIKEVYYDEESNLDIPTKEQISSIESWFKENKHKLFWDVETYFVKLLPDGL